MKSLEELPRKEKFFSSLTDSKISDKEYEHVLNVWEKIEMKKMKDYHDLYLKCDILLLADALQKFRTNSSKDYVLCPSHYLSAPGLSWDAMLKMTKIKLQPIPDPGIYIFFEECARVEISLISKRGRKDNNIYLKSYDPKQESKHVIYLDANNLYDYAYYITCIELVCLYFLQDVDSYG